jgi:signal transduction histidine kinase
MTFKKLIRNLIIGNDKFIESYSDFRQAMLSGHIAIIATVLCLVYSGIAIVLQYYTILTVFFTAAIFTVASIYFHRIGKHRQANFILLISLNILVYIIGAGESPNTGTYIYFLAIAIAPFAIFPYCERLTAILFCISTYILFILAYFVGFSILPKRSYPDDLLLFYVIVNFTAALPTTIMSVYLLITLNHYSNLKLFHANEQLTKTNKELDRFVYSTSHDLRAPLTSLLGLINITAETKRPEEIQRYLGMMRERVHSLDKFIKDITDYSRNNRLEITREPVKLHELATEVWESLRFSPEAERIRFSMEIAEDVTVKSDKNRLKVILSNLLSNAIRYHDSRKAEPYIHLKAEVKGRVFYMKVEDNGQGIASEYHAKVFEMFYRANEHSKGSGLGLYIVKEALMKLSGTIQLESSPGLGSVFTIKLPKY